MAITDNLISFWELNVDDTNQDDSHGTNDGTIEGTTFTASGKLSNAYDFDGSDDYITIPYDTDFDINASDLSISAWINLGSSGSGYDAIVGHYKGASNYWIFRARHAGRSNVSTFQLYSNESGGTQYYCDGTDLRGAGWVHIVVTVNNTTKEIKLYENTTLRDTTAYLGTAVNTEDLALGDTSPSTDHPFDGIIDEVGIWNKVLSTDEISSLYNSGDGLAYPFTTGTNTQINIGDAWKDIEAMQVNIGDAWKSVAGAQINIGDAWKTIF